MNETRFNLRPHDTSPTNIQLNMSFSTSKRTSAVPLSRPDKKIRHVFNSDPQSTVKLDVLEKHKQLTSWSLFNVNHYNAKHDQHKSSVMCFSSFQLHTWRSLPQTSSSYICRYQCTSPVTQQWVCFIFDENDTPINNSPCLSLTHTPYKRLYFPQMHPYYNSATLGRNVLWGLRKRKRKRKSKINKCKR